MIVCEWHPLCVSFCPDFKDGCCVSSHFLILFSINSVEKTATTIYVIVDLSNFLDFCEYMLIHKFDTSSMFQTSWERSNKRLGKLKKTQTPERSTRQQVQWYHTVKVSLMVIERLSCSRAKIARHTTLQNT